MITVTLYTKPGCHLCDAVHQVITQVRRHRLFDLQVRNILDDPTDHDRYQHAIPVVLLNGHELTRHRLTPSQLEAALTTAEGRPPSPPNGPP